jgi:hypothetical protein
MYIMKKLSFMHKVAVERNKASGYSFLCNKNAKPEFSRTKGGGSRSPISISVIDLEISSTENGMLH